MGPIGVSPEDIVIRHIIMALPLALCVAATSSSAAERVDLEARNAHVQVSRQTLRRVAVAL